MRNSRAIRIASALLLATASSLALESQAQAQMKRPMPDDHGIDAIAGAPFIPSGKLTIGDPAQGGLEFYRVWEGGGTWFHNLQGTIKQNGSVFTVAIGPSVESFTLSGTTYNSDDGRGSTLIKNVSGSWTYTLADGTVITFENPGTLSDIQSSIKGMLASIVRPNGFLTTFTNQYQTFCEKVGTRCDTAIVTYVRLKSVTTNTGYQIHLDYIHNASSTSTEDLGFSDGWLQLSVATALNNTIDYCAPSADSCSFTQSWPAVTISKASGVPGTFTDTWVDSLSHTTTAQVTSNQLASIQSPANPSTDFSLTYDTSGRVASFAQGGGTWNYTYSDVGTQRTTTVTQPLGGSRVYVSDTALRKLLSVTDELGHATSYSFDSFVRPTQVTQPEGNSTQLTYDARGNVTQTRNVAKSGSGLADIVTSANFDTTCANPKTCNKPNSVIDAKGNETDFTYDSTHGGVLTVTRPAPTTGAVRPQTRFGYTALFGYYKNSSGTIVAGPSSITKLTSASACQTGSSCAGTSDEVKSTIAYGSTGVANNLLPTSLSSGSGDGVLTATTARTYDIFGNVTNIDGPLPGTGDTSGFSYDADRQLTLAVGPDPDGAGSLLRRAQRFTYDANGNVTLIEAGTASSLTGPFTPDSSGIREQIGYDSLGRKVTDAMVSGPTGTPVTNTLVQASYDTKGRPNCSAVRMNSAVYGSLPSDSCTLGTAGSSGPDRISQAVYDNADEVTQLKEAVGTSDAATERTLTYSNNSKLATLLDGENNLTTYEYDGFDRLSKTRYPNTTKGSGTSSTTDYEQLGYDANSNVTSHRLRDGNSIGFTFDNLNRVTFKDLPGSEPDVTIAYDNLGRPTSASQSGNSLSFTYDALSRQLTEVGPQGTATSVYDLAGRRTQLTYPGSGLYVNYDYLVNGAISAIRENGATSGVGVLATYGYDNLGRRTSMTFGNGASQVFTYDAVSRLASLTNDLSGTTNDLSVSFSYNPASQIAGTVRTGDAYAYGGNANVNRSYTSNGLNQYSAAGSASLTYDTKGNLTSDGTSSFTYSSENLLTSAPSSTSLSYDPAMRLYQIAGAATTRFAYDGQNMLAEYDGSNALQRRFVFGPGGQPIVQYEGSGTTTRRFLSSDERGSIVSATDSSGTLIGINSYDEYGIPGASNVGRFQYTGQAWLPELGLYYYKARFYSPTLGRFMQTDPVGYGDGPNWYAYAHSDPIDNVDPLGTCPEGFAVVVPATGHSGNSAPPAAKGEIVVNGQRCKPIPSIGHGSGGAGPAPGGSSGTTSRRVTSEDIQAAQQAWINACHADPTSAACAAARQHYLDLYQQAVRQDPLPPTGQFVDVIPDSIDTTLDLAGCVALDAGVITSVAAATLCAKGSLELAHTVFPERKRVK